MDTFKFKPTLDQHCSKNAYWLGQCASLAYNSEEEIKEKTAGKLVVPEGGVPEMKLA